MAKNRVGIAVLLLIALALVLRLYWHDGLPYTHDGENHVARFADYAAALRQGQFPPRLAPNLWSRVGYPVFLFNYPLSNILSVPFSVINIPYVVTYKLLASLYIVGGAVGLWFWLKTLPLKLRNKSAAIAVLAWLSFPYIVSTLYFRGNIGEVAAYGLLPWLFLGVEWAKDTNKWKTVVIGLVTMAFLLSHNIAAVFVWPLVLAYAIFRSLTIKSFWQTWLWPTLLGGLATTWFWLPAIFEKHYTVLNGSSNNSVAPEHAPTLIQLLVSPVRFGFSYFGAVDTLSFSVGLVWVVTALAVVLLVSKKLARTEIHWLHFSLASLVILVGLQIKPFAQIWSLPIANFIQFPWRLSIFIGLFLSLLSAIVWQQIGRIGKLVILVGLLVAFWSVLQAKPADYVYKTDVDYASFPHSTSTQNENLPVTFTGLIGELPAFASVTTGEGKVALDLWKGHRHSYNVHALSPVVISESTLYYPGWEIIARNLDTDEVLEPPISADLNKGWLSYPLPAGNYHIVTRFEENTWPRIVGNILSLIAIAAILTKPTILARRAKG